MKIVYGWPPNIDLILQHFDIPQDCQVYFAYGDTLYSPRDQNVPAKIIAHEKVHMDQQLRYITETDRINMAKYAAGPRAWWERYIDDPEFRLSQEYASYGTQVAYVRQAKGSAAAQTEVNLAAEVLASPIYGDCVSVATAKMEILKHSIL